MTAAPDDRPADRSRRAPVWALLGLTLVYVVLTAVTESRFTGDAPDYADSIQARFDGRFLDWWDPGHLLWRQLGFVLARLTIPDYDALSQAAFHLAIVNRLAAVAWLSGLCAALLTFLWLRRHHSDTRAAWGALAMIGLHGVLNFAQSGSAYVTALALLTTGIYTLGLEPNPRRSWLPAVLAGLCFAAAVFIWMPFILVLPGALLSALISPVESRVAWRRIVTATVTAGVLGFAVYLGIWRHAAPNTPLPEWIASASHGLSDRGIARMGPGLVRTLVFPGETGVLAKRFLNGDRYNPLTAADFATRVAWKLAVPLAGLALVVLAGLWSWKSRKVTGMLALFALPTLVFASRWQGGDAERYLPLYPALAFLVAAAMRPGGRGMTAIVGSGVLAMTAVNVMALSSAVADSAEASVRARSGLGGGATPPPWLWTTLTPQDPFINFQRSYEGRAYREGLQVPVTHLVQPSALSAEWSKEFAGRALQVWDQGSKVLLSRRLLAERPAASWDWVERPDQEVGWEGLRRFVADLEFGATHGNQDGFVEIPPTPANVARMRSAAQ